MNTSERCTLLGILDDGWDGLTPAAQRRLTQAGVVVGAARTLELVASHLSADVTRHAMDGQLDALPGWIAAAQAEGRQVVVLATGDPLCHGIGAWLGGKLGRDALDIVPAPSTLQLAFARLGKSWQDVAIASCHSRDAGEWEFGATPAHGLYPLMRSIARHARVAAFTGPQNTPARLARALVTAGYGDEARISVACRLRLPDEHVFADLTPAEAAAMDFPEPNVVLVERPPEAKRPAFGLEDDDYQQRFPEKGLITKQEARALSLAKLRLVPDAVVWDIGAGSGSVGLEAARLAPLGHVWAIEKNEGDAANALANARRFRIGNYTLHEGRAPDGLDTWPDPDAVFIGGSGGELTTLIDLILARLKPGGRLVMNFVTLENLATATSALTAANAQWDVVQLQASRSQPILDMHRMAAQNPVWIVTASISKDMNHGGHGEHGEKPDS
jgi:precorrin-6Y C5,15-methyltransferase (decarboxylating)